MRTTFLALTCWILLACLASSAIRAAEGLDAQTNALWERHWRLYAQNCAEFEGGFICCPGYDRRYPSSAGMTVRQAEAELAEKVKVHVANMIYTKTIKMPVGEAEAMAQPIPKLAIGQYGYLTSVEVDEVLGPESMMVTDPTLIDSTGLNREYRADRARARQANDADQAEAIVEHMYSQRYALVEKQKKKAFSQTVFRLDGYPTAGLTKGEGWAGPTGEGIQLLIAGKETYGSERRPRERLVAVALDKVRFGLDEAGFIRLLETRGLTPASFVKLVMDRMGEHQPDIARQMVFQALLTPNPAQDEATADPTSPDETNEEP